MLKGAEQVQYLPKLTVNAWELLEVASEFLVKIYCTVLKCTVQNHTVLYDMELYSIVPFGTVQYCTVWNCEVLYSMELVTTGHLQGSSSGLSLPSS